MAKEREVLVEKIRKLLALSQSDNQHEAELAAERASKLLEEHQITMSEVELQDVKRQGVMSEYYTIPGLKMRYVWVTRLAWAAAKLYDAEILDINSLHGTTVLFIGYPDDVGMAKTTLEYLYRSWERIVARDLAEAKAKNPEYKFRPKDTMKFKLGHGQGYAMALFRRAVTLARQRKQNVQASGSTGTSLVVMKEKEVNETVSLHTTGKSRAKQQGGSALGYRAGSEAGKNIALGGEIEG